MVTFSVVHPEDISIYWKTVLDTIQEGLLIISTAGVILSVNRAAEELTGYKSSELVGQPCTILECTGCKLLSPDMAKEWCELFVSGEVRSKRCLVKGKGRVDIQVLKQASILRGDSGHVLGAVEALSDMRGVVKQEKEILKLRRTLAKGDDFHGLVGYSEPMQRVFSLIEDAARSEATVVIYGESGTGKELVARSIHALSSRAKQPFIKVDCVAFNENILESELFGHVKGAFTGAERSRVGRFEAANGGTVFLDEIGDFSLSIQVKLLRVLEDRVIEKVGDHRPVNVDVRVIAATNRDFSQLMKDGLFREDLFYRINVVPIKLPPLRERPGDIAILAGNFVEKLAAKTGKPIEGFSSEALARLVRYPWPGNVRQLKNAVEYAGVVCRGGLIELEHLPEALQQPAKGSAKRNKELLTSSWPGPNLQTGLANKTSGPSSLSGPGSRRLEGPSNLADEKSQLIEALNQTNGNQSEAARVLGVSRMTVWKKMKKFGLDIKTVVNHTS